MTELEHLYQENRCMITKTFYVYILSTDNNRVLYIGVTNDLLRRLNEHRNNLNSGFTFKYNVHKLVYFESFVFIEDAINREKHLKEWKREWKDNLIRKENPNWRDLTPTL